MEGRYEMKDFAKTAEESEAETITDPGSLEKDKKIEKNERQSKLIERRTPSFTENIYEYFVEYSNYTTIQGIRYVGEQSRTILERVIWLAVFCISLYFCINQIMKTYTKWDTSPVLVSFDTRATPLWEIPFPAVTICSSIKALKSKYNYQSKYGNKLWAFWSQFNGADKPFNYVSLSCNNIYQQLPINKGNITLGYFDTIEFLMKVGPNFNDTMNECIVSYKSCESSFTPILTEEGICYTFNMLDRNEIFRDNVLHYGNLMSNKRKSEGWTLGAGYKKNNSRRTYPERATLTLQYPLKIKLHADEDEISTQCMPSKGFKIILHNPAETPDVTRNFVYAPFNQEVQIAIKPEMMTTSDDLKKYDPHTRQCYFPEERQLEFYHSYTQANCEMECLAKLTRKICGCVALHMPYEKGTPICGIFKRICVRSARELIDENDKELHNERKESEDNSTLTCDCLPGCTSLDYTADTSQVDIKVHRGNLTTTKVDIYFKGRQFIASTRNELYSKTDFLANCGGLLGLFTGFSFLSVVEILYFLSLRLLCNIKRYGRHYWSGSQELVKNEKYDHKN